MLNQRLQNILTLRRKSLLLGALSKQVVIQFPAGLSQARNLTELKVFALFLGVVQLFVEFPTHHLMHHINHNFTLLFDNTRYVLVVDPGVDFALHHSGATVILNISFPPLLGHLQVFGEALLPEVLDGVVVGVGYEVVQGERLRVRLQPIH